MKSPLKKLLCAVLSAVLLLLPLCCASASGSFEFLTFPEAAVSDYDPAILTGISSGDNYASNSGSDTTSLFISPFWSMRVDGETVPVYATSVYDWALDRGVVQSFQYLFADPGTALNVELTFGGEINSAVILPASLGVTPAVNSGTLKAELTENAAYTILINGDSQEYAVTLFVRENTDEDAEIAALGEKYGSENVTVYEKGVYTLDTLPARGGAIYFKRGAFIRAAHVKDITCDAEADAANLPPFADFSSLKGAVVTGCGTFDFTALDRRERTLFTMNFCENSVFENLLFLNPNSWTVTAYACEGCGFNNITVFGWRTNSDGVNICGCDGVTVTGCFCRNGDDSFSVKTTNELFPCRRVAFTGCVGWSNKARCFGITGEVFSEISDITFDYCAVIVRNAVWDNDRTASLAVSAETGGADINNVTFSNIEIHRDDGRAILCLVYGEDISGCNMNNIVFRNISFSAGERCKLSSERLITRRGRFCARLAGLLGKLGIRSGRLVDLLHSRYNNSNGIDVEFENVKNGGHMVCPAFPARDVLIEGNVTLK